MARQSGGMTTHSVIGDSPKRREDQRFITGKGQYTDDISRPGETRALFVRSPHAHADVKKVDITAARKAPGVLAVFTGQDVKREGFGDVPCLVPLDNKDGTPRADNTWAHNNGTYSLYLTVAQPEQPGPNAIKPGENLNPVKTLRAAPTAKCAARVDPKECPASTMPVSQPGWTASSVSASRNSRTNST